MDCLHVRGIRAYGYIGVFPEEQVLGQWFEVDVTLWLDLAPAGQSDRLDQTYDYSTMIPRVQHLIQTSRVKLVETLAETIAADILEQASLHQVRVVLTKRPSIPNFDGSIAVDITRPRGSE